MEKRISQTLERVGLALNACHNTITTDDVDAAPVPDYSWRIDNSREIDEVEALRSLFATDTGTCPVCGCCSSRPSTGH